MVRRVPLTDVVMMAVLKHLRCQAGRVRTWQALDRLSCTALALQMCSTEGQLLGPNMLKIT
jgi:hypothetical protein